MGKGSENMKIAVIDDEQGILLTIRLYLEMEGYTPLVFSSPLEALKRLTTEKVDMIILDMRMPEMGGEELARILKKNPYTKDIPLVLFSAHEMLDEAAERLNAYDVLEKPFQFEELERIIRSVAKAAG